MTISPSDDALTSTDALGLPRSWSKAEVCAALHISRRTIDRLFREGKVSYYLAGRSQRFLARHVNELVAALEVRPDPAPVATPAEIQWPGLTPRSAARRQQISATRPNG